MSNVRMPFKWVNTSNLMTFECCFLISQYHENCSAMSSFAVLRHVPWNTYLQCSSMFSLVCYGFYLMFIYGFWFFYLWFLFFIFFSDAADNKQSYLNEISVERSIFKCNIQKSVPRSLQLQNTVIFKNRTM